MNIEYDDFGNAQFDGMSLSADEAAEFETRTDLSHAEQLEKFGWCICEGTNGEGQLADDCPR